jgi:putative toxin-antitoxin system antitoxin component (TIGR02293 family)
MEGPENPYQLINEAKKGVSLLEFDALIKDSGYSKSELAKIIGIDGRTIASYRKADRALTGKEAEHLIKLKKLFELGRMIFGKEEFIQWLRKPSYGLEGHTPEELLFYISGTDLVSNQLQHIIHGYVV